MQAATETSQRKTVATRRTVPQPIEAINHPGAHLRLNVVLSLVGMSRSAWYRLMEAKVAPQPLRFGTRCSRWIAADVSKFLAERTAQGAK